MLDASAVERALHDYGRQSSSPRHEHMSANPVDDEPYWPPGATSEKPKVVPIKPAPFPVVWVSDAVLELDSRPILKGLIEPGSFVVIYGPSGSGKSFFTADIAQHIAIGAPWRGRKVRQSLVVYVASEAGASIIKRFVAWRDNRLSDATEAVPLAVLTRGPNLLAALDVEKLTEQLSALQAECGLPLGLVVFDTLSRSIPGGDENSAEDMTMAVNAADYIREKFQAATVYVHHSGKDHAKGARGHSALFAAADLVLGVSDGVATSEKVRDGVAGERFPFTLEPVEIGTDCDGDPVMTCLLNSSADDGSSQPKKPPIRGIAATALSALREEIQENGQALPETSTIAKGARGVKLDQWRERFRVRYGDEKDPSVRAKAFWRSKESLLVAGAIGISDPWVWVV